MDWFALLIGLCLVATGALLFGYPVGLTIGKRQALSEVIMDYPVDDDAVLCSELVEVNDDDFEKHHGLSVR